MAVKINRSLDAVRICCAVGIGHVEILKWRKTGVQSWARYSYIDKVIYATTSSCLTSAQVPCIWSYVTSRLSIVLMTSPPCNNTVISQRVFTGETCWCETLPSVWHFLWVDLPLMVAHTPQCPECHLHGPPCLSSAYKLSSLDESHSLGTLSDWWRHTSRTRGQTDPISHFLAWREITLEASDYTVST